LRLETRASGAVLCVILYLSTAAAAPRGVLPDFEHIFEQLFPKPVAQLPMPSIATAPAVMPGCSVGPIPPLDDQEAQSFEAAAGTPDEVNLSGLTPATRIALARFQRSIATLGGKVEVTSAYRPPAYQAHLQVVWDKWMQLRGRMEPACAEVRAQVEDEFQRHGLLASQRPVPFSDHTRGVGFDAAVLLRRGRLDRVALNAGIRRPDVVRDPVHFRLIESLQRR
jgi:hypothetical protein